MNDEFVSSPTFPSAVMQRRLKPLISQQDLRVSAPARIRKMYDRAGEFGTPVRIQAPLEGRLYSRPVRLASLVVNRLAHSIIGGEIAAGSTLPTEGALGEEFGVSRTVTREALKALEERGLVRVEQGRGTTVQSREYWAMLDSEVLDIALQYDSDLVLLADLVRVRRALEADMTRVATPRLSDEDLDRLADNLRRMQEAKADYAVFSQADLTFHRIIMRASGSEVGRAIVSTIHAFGSRRPVLNHPVPSSVLDRTVLEHGEVLEALRSRDSDLAASRIAAHIESAWSDRLQVGNTEPPR